MNDSNPFDELGASQNIEQTEKPSSNRKYYAGFLVIAVLFLVIGVLALFKNKQTKLIDSNYTPFAINQTPSASPTPSTSPIPNSKILTNGGYHVFQSFNNCGPAALSMALRFYGINASQEILGQALRPYQIPFGDNDDKSVTLEEVANKAREYGLIPYLRPMGNDELVKQFIANDIPVITRTWLNANDDIGHYRIIKGYDETRGIFIQDDSLQGKDLEYTYHEYNNIWKKFNYEYLVLVPTDKEDIARQIIGEDVDENNSWEKAKENSLNELKSNPSDTDAGFNLSVAYYKLGEYEKSVEEFEKVENKLSFRTLWYQIDPILSYYELGNDERVLQITERVLNNQNRAFSELYILRGKIYERQGNNENARQEYQKAIFYNSNLKEAQDLYNSI